MVKGVRLFLGFANYYYIFIKGFNDLAAPLVKLIKKGCDLIKPINIKRGTKI